MHCRPCKFAAASLAAYPGLSGHNLTYVTWHSCCSLNAGGSLPTIQDAVAHAEAALHLLKQTVQQESWLTAVTGANVQKKSADFQVGRHHCVLCHRVHIAAYCEAAWLINRAPAHWTKTSRHSISCCLCLCYSLGQTGAQECVLCIHRHK